MYNYYLQYWKQFLYMLIILFGIFQIDSENDLLLIVVFIFTVYFISSYLKTPKGIKNAILKNDLDAVTKYLDKETNLDLKNGKWSSLIVLASSSNLPEIVKLLIERGANVNQYLEHEKNVTPLYISVVRKHREVANLLLANGAVLDPYSAAFLGKVEVVKDYLEQNGDISVGKYQGITLIHTAAWNNQLEMTQYLITCGAKVNSQDDYGRTPLHFAASNPEGIKLIELLIDNGAKLDAIANRSFTISGNKCLNGTPLHVAARLNYPDIAEALIIRGANINATYMRGKTPLHTAVWSKNNFEVVKVTIDRGADINAYEKSQGKTPLHRVAYYGHTDIAELLILNGAKVNFRNFSGYTPLTSAETGRHSEMYSLLVRYGATY